MGIFKNIKDGWLNSMKAGAEDGLDPKIQELAENRAKICGECPELKSSGFFRTLHKIVNNSGVEMLRKVRESYLTEDQIPENLKNADWDQGFKCGQCGCQFPANVYAPEKKCPLGKW